MASVAELKELVDALAAADAAQSEQIANLASALGKSVHGNARGLEELSQETNLDILWLLFGTYLVFFMQPRSLFCVAPHSIGMIKLNLTNRLLSSGRFRAPGGGIREGQEHKEHPAEERLGRLPRRSRVVGSRIPIRLRQDERQRLRWRMGECIAFSLNIQIALTVLALH
eukprot:1177704-Prorocentrum_minimum.AAC.1